MDAIEAILTRRSTRKFTGRPIAPETLHQLLEAAMSGPCCVNAREWSFIVVTDKERPPGPAAETGGRRYSRLRGSEPGVPTGEGLLGH